MCIKIHNSAVRVSQDNVNLLMNNQLLKKENRIIERTSIVYYSKLFSIQIKRNDLFFFLVDKNVRVSTLF